MNIGDVLEKEFLDFLLTFGSQAVDIFLRPPAGDGTPLGDHPLLLQLLQRIVEGGSGDRKKRTELPLQGLFKVIAMRRSFHQEPHYHQTQVHLLFQSSIFKFYYLNIKSKKVKGK